MRQEEAHSNTVRRRLFIALAVALVLIWVVWSQWDRIGALFDGAGPGTPAQETADTTGNPAGLPPAAEGPEPAPPPPTAEELAWSEVTGRPPAWPVDLEEPQSCDGVQDAYAALCARLESHPAIRESDFSGGVCDLLVDVAEELASRPPGIGSELKDHAVMVGNTFHLFRVLGRERINLLRKLAADETLIEPLSMVLWQRFASRRRCLDPESAVGTEALYDYAAFGFQTIGGQAYMRRRSPRQEALVAFYGLLALDRAMAQNHNPHGVDPRPEIRRTRELIAGRGLLFEEQYLRRLEEMATRWERPSSGSRTGAGP